MKTDRIESAIGQLIDVYLELHRSGYGTVNVNYVLEDLDNLAAIINSEEEEKATDCNELEEAAEDAMPEEYGFIEIDMYGGSEAVYSREQMLAMFKSGANWQREQFHDACYQCEKAYDNVFFRGEQHAIKMMKEDAIERTVKEDAGGYPYIDETELYDYEKDEPTAKKGDKVKIIILKDGNED